MLLSWGHEYDFCYDTASPRVMLKILSLIRAWWPSLIYIVFFGSQSSAILIYACALIVNKTYYYLLFS